MNDEQLLRYSRHILLEAIGIEGQQRLLDAHALVIGAGGLGSPVALFLGSAGVGRITVADPDVVELTNLQRQIAHDMAGLGQHKAESVRARVAALNPQVQVQACVVRADATWLDAQVPGADVIIDCSDNYATRQAVNAACVRHGKPLVWGAATGFDAQVSALDPRTGTHACYACIFAPQQAFEEVACATMGVFAPLVGIVGSIQAAEALKMLAGLGMGLSGRLLMLDARSMRWDEVATARRADCPVCGATASAPAARAG